MGRNLDVNPDAMKQIAKLGQDLLHDTATDVVAQAKRTAPVLTGQYRDGLDVDTTSSPDDLNVGSTSPHAIYVEARTGNLIRALQAGS